MRSEEEVRRVRDNGNRAIEIVESRGGAGSEEWNTLVDMMSALTWVLEEDEDQ